MMMRRRRLVVDAVVLVILLSVALFNILLEPPLFHLGESPIHGTSTSGVVTYSSGLDKKGVRSRGSGRDVKAPGGSVPAVASAPSRTSEANEAMRGGDKSGEASRRRRAIPDVVPGDTKTLEDLEDGEDRVEWALDTPRLDCGCGVACDTVAMFRVNNATRPMMSDCEMRIWYHMGLKGADEENRTAVKEACAAAADEGKCGMECHPDRCLVAAAGRLPPPPLDWTKVKEDAVAAEKDRGKQQHQQQKPPRPFVRHPGVVVANKVHSADELQKLKQMICLFTAAYNHRVNYDIVVFTTVPWRRWQVAELRSVAPQTKITVVRDSPSLRDQLATLNPADLEFLRRRCGVKEGENITWSHTCYDPVNYSSWYINETLSYGWQAEFRSYHLWKTKVLAPYKYMIWMDTDAFCTRPWAHDPIQDMVEKDLVLMIDNFPQGEAANPRIIDKVKEAYGNRTLCTLDLREDGFHPQECTKPDARPFIGLVHGFMHITNLDFYRSEASFRYLELHVGDYRFSREWDDQLAVTVPAAMLAPQRVRELEMLGNRLALYHNGDWDGKTRHEKYGFEFYQYWVHEGRDQWDIGRDMCNALVLFND